MQSSFSSKCGEHLLVKADSIENVSEIATGDCTSNKKVDVAAVLVNQNLDLVEKVTESVKIRAEVPPDKQKYVSDVSKDFLAAFSRLEN